ncbi:hypothetical protein, partial [Cellulomonas algicola]|uniref:hypothetical protein n=1 Tax=Cellulomonas algicola TaxID=2071633 RepID=UPI001B356B7D
PLVAPLVGAGPRSPVVDAAGPCASLVVRRACASVVAARAGASVVTAGAGAPVVGRGLSALVVGALTPATGTAPAARPGASAGSAVAVRHVRRGRA